MKKCFEMGKSQMDWTGLVGRCSRFALAKKLNHMLSVLEILIKKKITIFSLPLLGIEPRDSA